MRGVAKPVVLLGLLFVDAVIKQYDIQVDSIQIRSWIEKIIAAYLNSKEVLSWYYKNIKMLTKVESVVLEDQASSQYY